MRSMAERGILATSPGRRSALPSLRALSCAIRLRSPRLAPCSSACARTVQSWQRGLNLRTARFVKRLNDIAEEVQAPVRLRHFASWFMFELPHDAPLATLFFAYMRRHGVHIWEAGPAS